MLITTGSPDKYAYAAENQWHADMYNRNAAKSGQYNFATEEINSSAISSNAGVGEDGWKAGLHEWLYKDKLSGAYLRQLYYHK